MTPKDYFPWQTLLHQAIWHFSGLNLVVVLLPWIYLWAIFLPPSFSPFLPLSIYPSCPPSLPLSLPPFSPPFIYPSLDLSYPPSLPLTNSQYKLSCTCVCIYSVLTAFGVATKSICHYAIGDTFDMLRRYHTCQAFLTKNCDMHVTNAWFEQRMHEICSLQEYLKYDTF